MCIHSSDIPQLTAESSPTFVTSGVSRVPPAQGRSGYVDPLGIWVRYWFGSEPYKFRGGLWWRGIDPEMPLDGQAGGRALGKSRTERSVARTRELLGGTRLGSDPN